MQRHQSLLSEDEEEEEGEDLSFHLTLLDLQGWTWKPQAVSDAGCTSLAVSVSVLKEGESPISPVTVRVGSLQVCLVTGRLVLESQPLSSEGSPATWTTPTTHEQRQKELSRSYHQQAAPHAIVSLPAAALFSSDREPRPHFCDEDLQSTAHSTMTHPVSTAVGTTTTAVATAVASVGQQASQPDVPQAPFCQTPVRRTFASCWLPRAGTHSPTHEADLLTDCSPPSSVERQTRHARLQTWSSQQQRPPKKKQLGMLELTLSLQSHAWTEPDVGRIRLPLDALTEKNGVLELPVEPIKTKQRGLTWLPHPVLRLHVARGMNKPEVSGESTVATRSFQDTAGLMQPILENQHCKPEAAVPDAARVSDASSDDDNEDESHVTERGSWEPFLQGPPQSPPPLHQSDCHGWSFWDFLPQCVDDKQVAGPTTEAATTMMASMGSSVTSTIATRPSWGL